MPTVLLVFEFLGTTELMVIALVALIIFGPRKLPEIGRKLGRGMAEFKRASEDFKRTWEYEVEVERRQEAAAPRVEQETEAARTSLLPEGSGGVAAEDLFDSQAARPASAPDDAAQPIPRAPAGEPAPDETEAKAQEPAA